MEVVTGGLVQRFQAKVQTGDGCWLWTGPHNRCGYGLFWLSRGSRRESRLVLAHRVAYSLEYGAIPDGFLICHHCDNPGCVRPDHLFLGTSRDNTQDMIRKGRDHPILISHACQLNYAEHQELRLLYSLGIGSHARLGRRYGVSTSTVKDALDRDTIQGRPLPYGEAIAARQADWESRHPEVETNRKRFA